MAGSVGGYRYLTDGDEPDLSEYTQGLANDIKVRTDELRDLITEAQRVADAAAGRAADHDNAPVGAIAMQSGGQTIASGNGVVLQLTRNVETYQGMRAANQFTRMLTSRPGAWLAIANVAFDPLPGGTTPAGAREMEVRLGAGGNVASGRRIGDRQVDVPSPSGRALLSYAFPFRSTGNEGVELFGFQSQGVGVQVGINTSLSLVWLAP